MKRDAFDDDPCPFDYPAELNKAREALNAKVGRYISENPAAGYRELSKQFGISSATLCAIAKKYSRKRKPGRRSCSNRVKFDVRSNTRGKEILTRVTVVAADARNASVESMRRLVCALYKTDGVAKVESHTKPDREVEFSVRELEQLVSRASALKERQGLP